MDIHERIAGAPTGIFHGQRDQAVTGVRKRSDIRDQMQGLGRRGKRQHKAVDFHRRSVLLDHRDHDNR